MSRMYRVEWAIDVDADSPEEAATKALITMRDSDPLNSAVVFDVIEHDSDGTAVRVDLYSEVSQ